MIQSWLFTQLNTRVNGNVICRTHLLCVMISRVEKPTPHGMGVILLADLLVKSS